MSAALHTAGPWYWHTDFQGRVSLRTPDRGQLIVMQFVRSGMQGAAPRFSRWRGLEVGEPRGRQGGIMELGIDHPDARLIATSPRLLEAAQAAWNCIAELPATQARAEVAQMLCEAIAAATGQE